MLYRFLIKGCPIPHTSNLVDLCQCRRMIPGVSSSSQNWYNSLFVSKNISSPKKDQTSKTSENPAFSHSYLWYLYCEVISSVLSKSSPHISCFISSKCFNPWCNTSRTAWRHFLGPLGSLDRDPGPPVKVVKTHSKIINSTWIRIKLQDRNGNNFITQYILDTEFRGGTYPLQVDKLRR